MAVTTGAGSSRWLLKCPHCARVKKRSAIGYRPDGNRPNRPGDLFVLYGAGLDTVGTYVGINERGLKKGVGPQMRRINGKLTAADRSEALFLLAHNPKVAGSNPARDLNPR